MEFISTWLNNQLERSGDLQGPLTSVVSNSTFFPQSVFMSFIWFSEQTAVISRNSINQLIFVTDKLCVFFEARNEIFKYDLDEIPASVVKSISIL
jgi:hypothetical protein